METVVLDKTLFILFGSVITLLLAVISYFLKQSNQEIKEMLSKVNDHETRITVNENDIKRHEHAIGKSSDELATEIVMKLRAMTPR